MSYELATALADTYRDVVQREFYDQLNLSMPVAVSPVRPSPSLCLLLGVIQQLRGLIFHPILTTYPPRVDNCEHFTYYLTFVHVTKDGLSSDLPLIVHVVFECPSAVLGVITQTGLWLTYSTKQEGSASQAPNNLLDSMTVKM